MEMGSKSQIAIVICLLLFLACVSVFNLGVRDEQQFSYLAKSFLKGKLYFTEIPGNLADTAPFAGKNYWPLGPLPAIVLIPFVYIFQWLKLFFYQGYLQIFFVFGVLRLIYKISRLLGFREEDSLYLAFAFSCASVFVGVALLPWSWYFAQVVTTFLLFCFLLEFLAKKRPLVLGSIAGALLLTRVTASLIFLVYVLDLIQSEKAEFKFRKFVRLMTPYLISLTALCMYNYLRFGNLMEQGYAFQLIPIFAQKARDLGIISFAHLPANLYYFLLAGPLPVFRDEVSHVLGFPFVRANPWGMSLFVTSPYFIFLMFQKYRERLTNNLLIVSMLIFLPTVFYYGVGFRQFGYRYSLDFLPLLFIVFAKKYSEKSQVLSLRMKFLLISTAFANIYLFLTFLGHLPQNI